MPHNPPDIKELRAIIDWVNLTDDVREVSLSYGDVELFISRDRQSSNRAFASAPSEPAAAPVAAPAPAPKPAAAAAAAPAPTRASEASVPSAEPAANEIVVKAPMVGVFYAAPKPGARPFVEVGDEVEVGTALCIVEVMKLMNSVEAQVAGTVTRILVDNEQAVEYGQPLMVIARA